MVNGVNPAAFFILPMLGMHPDEIPRFRDCFVVDEEIHVYTRVGGNNRGEGYGEDMLYSHPNYKTTFDDDFDNTFGTYVFSIPDKWKSDFELITSGKGGEVSKEYVDQMIKVYPKLEEKIKEIFRIS